MLLGLSLSLLLFHTAPAMREGPAAQDKGERHLVLAALFGLQWSTLSGVPSGEVTLFVGSSLRPRTGRLGRRWKTALGYAPSLSLGGAERATAFFSWGGDYGILYHRHHLAALGHGGPGDRLYYQFSGGLLMWRSTPNALEAEVRLGVVLGVRRPGRVKGVVGGEARVVAILSGLAFPHFGVFAGLAAF
ncbi:hypothetical protein [Nannocystis pusilla]|uniref:DUF3575 domain-containing protein n=1 Tax=Nannocystis pusilla TaxID=889268 RepID=A0ABS7TNG3_9BACT|nr:hypothetical protein [Nannocystis pusilla]MBZ5709764.1 hypothetical protein [Nannocystis pusilla]